MALGSVKLDSLISSTQTFAVDDLATQTDVSSSFTDWSVVNTTATLAANTRYLVDSSTAGFTLTLPATPTAGQFVTLADSEGSFSTNNVTVAQNGSNIVGQAADLVLDVDRAVVIMIYSGDATTGWLVK